MMVNTVLIEYPQSQIVQDLLHNIVRRADKGMVTYGHSIDDCKMSALQSLKESVEETTDACVYLGKGISEVSQYDQAKASRWCQLQARAIDLSIDIQREIFDIQQAGKVHDSNHTD